MRKPGSYSPAHLIINSYSASVTTAHVHEDTACMHCACARAECNYNTFKSDDPNLRKSLTEGGSAVLLKSQLRRSKWYVFHDFGEYPPTQFLIHEDRTLSHSSLFVICDRIWENPLYGIRARFAQCAFLVAQVQICQSPDFVIYMSNNPSSNCCRLLRRLVVLYEGEISLHLDPPSRHSRRTRSPLLWAVISILYLDTARFIDLLYVRSPF